MTSFDSRNDRAPSDYVLLPNSQSYSLLVSMVLEASKALFYEVYRVGLDRQLAHLSVTNYLFHDFSGWQCQTIDCYLDRGAERLDRSESIFSRDLRLCSAPIPPPRLANFDARRSPSLHMRLFLHQTMASGYLLTLMQHSEEWHPS